MFDSNLYHMFRKIRKVAFWTLTAATWWLPPTNFISAQKGLVLIAGQETSWKRLVTRALSQKDVQKAWSVQSHDRIKARQRILCSLSVSVSHLNFLRQETHRTATHLPHVLTGRHRALPVKPCGPQSGSEPDGKTKKKLGSSQCFWNIKKFWRIDWHTTNFAVWKRTLWQFKVVCTIAHSSE